MYEAPPGPPISAVCCVLLPAVCLAVFRNWMYLICVAYKVSRRLGLLGVHNFWDRLTGWALTFVGMLMAIWQNLGHAVAELAIDVLLMKYVVSQGYSHTGWKVYRLCAGYTTNSRLICTECA